MSNEDTKEQLYDSIRPRERWILDCCYFYDYSMDPKLIRAIFLQSQACFNISGLSHSKQFYVDFIARNVVKYKIPFLELMEMDSEQIVDCAVKGYSFEDILDYDSNLEYAFTTKDDKRVYLNDDGFFVKDNNGEIIEKPNGMVDPVYDLFTYYLGEDMIKSMSMRTHANIRSVLKEEIFGDDFLEKEYENGIKNYRKFCKERNILSYDINKALFTKNDMDIFEEDKIYSPQKKENFLKGLLHELGENKVNKYKYIASFTNNVDYYRDLSNGKYLAIDANKIMKEFDNNSLFLLKNIGKNEDFIFLEKSEAEKIADELSLEVFKETSFCDTHLSAVKSFLKAVDYKELKVFDNMAYTLLKKMCLLEENKIKKDKKSTKEKEL